jgi:RNA polymerase sigma factor (sigma-70 family)
MMAIVERATRERDNTSSWHELVRRFAPYVHAIAVGAYRLPEPKAHEVFREVFAATWERLHELDDDAVRTWIATLARRLAHEAWEGLEGDLQPPADALLARLDGALTAREAVRRLPPTQREVATRYWFDAQDEPAIAAAIGLPVEAVTAYLERARRRLRVELERMEPGGC